MEKCAFLQKHDAVPETRVYTGHVSCPGFLEDSDWMISLLCPVTLVLPPLKDALLPEALRLTERLYERNQAFEVSVNDLGTLAALHERFPSLALNAGPLLFPQDTDPLIFDFRTPKEESRSVFYRGIPSRLRWAPPGEACLDHWREPSVFAEEDALKALGVTRLEICSQPCMPRNAPGLPVTVYDSAFVTVLPCRSCQACRDLSPIQRGGRTLIPDKNLLRYDCGILPSFADRTVTSKTGGRPSVG